MTSVGDMPDMAGQIMSVPSRHNIFLFLFSVQQFTLINGKPNTQINTGDIIFVGEKGLPTHGTSIQIVHNSLEVDTILPERLLTFMFQPELQLIQG